MGKRNVGNRLKRVLPKFRADPSFVQGVNGRSKLRKNFEIRELAFEKVRSAMRTGLVGPVLMLRYVVYKDAVVKKDAVNSFERQTLQEGSKHF